MFFETKEFSVNNIFAFAESREKSVGKSGVRPYHALSFRIDGNAMFSFDNDTIQVGSGDVLLVPAYCEYQITAGYERLFIVHFNTKQPLADKIKKFSSKTPGVFQQYFKELIDSCS